MNERNEPAPVTIWRASVLQEVGFLVPLWASYVFAVGLLAALLTAFGVETGSFWEQATNAPRVFALIWGIFQTALYLPLLIAHGHTRREFVRLEALLVPAYVLLFSMLLAAGFVIEHVVYAALGWSHELSRDAALFDAPLQLPQIVLHYYLIIAVWISAGALLGAAFYRSGLLGMLAIAVALTLIGSAESLLDSGRVFPGFVTITDLSRSVRSLGAGPLVSLLTGAAVYVSLLGAALALTWAIIRDMPMRARHA